MRCVALETANCPAPSNRGASGAHARAGIGAGFVPSICRLDLADLIWGVSAQDALETARELGPSRRVATVIVDSGLNYPRGQLYG